jgi:hypothetical protein
MPQSQGEKGGVPDASQSDLRASGFTVEARVTLRAPAAGGVRPVDVLEEGDHPDGQIGWGLYIDHDRKAWFWARNQDHKFVGILTDKALPEAGEVHLCGTRDEHGMVALFVNGVLVDVNLGNDPELAWVFACHADVVAAVHGGLAPAATPGAPGSVVNELRLHARPIRRLDDEILQRGLPLAESAWRDAPALLRLPPLGERNAAGLSVSDREIRYHCAPPGQSPEPRPLPLTERFLTVAVPPVPPTMPSPYPGGGTLNVHFSDKRALTGNIYQEPGTARVLHLGFTTPGIDDTALGSVAYAIWYRISIDGGKTFGALRPVIQPDGRHDLLRPLDGVWIGRNGFNVDLTNRIIRASNGEIMVPFTAGTLDGDGKPYNPLLSYGYSSVGVLIGRWTDDGRDTTWGVGRWIHADPSQSSRGLAEPAIVELRQPGEFMLVARGSASRHIFAQTGVWTGYRNVTPADPAAPRRRWFAISRDSCRTWSAPQPMTYADGGELFSPGSCSTLFRSALNGRLYWIGNLLPPADRGPDQSNTRQRHWLVIGEVDEASFGLKRQSILTLDARHPIYDSCRMALSNFDVYEDPVTGTVLVCLGRGDYASGFFAATKTNCESWYRIGVPPA